MPMRALYAQAEWNDWQWDKNLNKEKIFRVVVFARNHVEMCTFLHALFIS